MAPAAPAAGWAREIRVGNEDTWELSLAAGFASAYGDYVAIDITRQSGRLNQMLPGPVEKLTLAPDRDGVITGSR